MNVLRSVALVAGVGFGALGAAITLIPGLTVGFRVSLILVAAIGTLALFLGLYFVAMRFAPNRQRQRLDLPTPEGRFHSTPGAEIDRQLASVSIRDRRDAEPSDPRRSIHSRVEQAAIAILFGGGAGTEEGLASTSQRDSGWTTPLPQRSSRRTFFRASLLGSDSGSSEPASRPFDIEPATLSPPSLVDCTAIQEAPHLRLTVLTTVARSPPQSRRFSTLIPPGRPTKTM
jgi:hypothetical protein